MHTKPLLNTQDSGWTPAPGIDGLYIQPLAEPVPGGSVHHARLEDGITIPSHTHPSAEFALLLSGKLSTPQGVLSPGTFWSTPAGERQGPYQAIGDVKLYQLRLGPMGEFETH